MNSPLEKLASIKKYLDAADDVLNSGYMPDITPLQKSVAEACEAVQKAPKELHDECLAALIEVVEQLNACEEKMRKLHSTKQSG